MSTGYIVSLTHQDPLLMFANPVSLSAINDWAGASYYSSLYDMKELGVAAVAGGKRIGNWVLALGISRFGFDYFNEKSIILGVSRPATSQFFWGATVRYLQLDIKRYPGGSTLLFDAGWKYFIDERFKISGGIRNLTRATFGVSNEPMPQSYQAGIQFLAEERVTLFGEIFKEVDFAPEIRFGAEVDALQILELRIGATRLPSRITGGMSLRVHKFRMEYGFSHHGILGYTHAVGIVVTK